MTSCTYFSFIQTFIDIMLDQKFRVSGDNQSTDLPPLVDWEHDGEGEREVRRDVEEVGPLVQRLLHHGVLLVVQTQYRLLQVAHPTVNQLRAPGDHRLVYNLYHSRELTLRSTNMVNG